MPRHSLMASKLSLTYFTYRPMRIRNILLMAVLLLAVQTAKSQSNLVAILSQPGDYIGQGLTYITTNQSDIAFSGTPASIHVSAFGFNIYFSGPLGTNLTVGTYTNAARWPF